MYKKMFETYVPKNEQEKIEQIQILAFIENNPDCLLRSNLTAHITTSAIIVNEAMDKVLFAHHNIYNSWGWVGGHNDGDPDLLHVALKEAFEETGLKSIRPFSEDLLMIETITVQNHIKNGQYVPDHLHMNATYLLLADELEDLEHNPEEHSDIKWFRISEVFSVISEEHMKPIYEKAFQTIKDIKEKM